MTSIWNTIFAPGLFSYSFVVHAWVAASAIAVLAALVGFFVNLRGEAFVAHAVPRGAFAGAAGAFLIGVNSILGLSVFAILMALGMGLMRRRSHNGVITALALVTALGLGDLFLTVGNTYAPEVFALLFGQLLGISGSEMVAISVLSVCLVGVIAVVYRPLLLASTVPDFAAARGVSLTAMNVTFTLLVALAASLTVPVVGALLAFSLMIGPAAAGWYLAKTPWGAMVYSVGIALGTVWVAIVIGYDSSLPIGFLVAGLSLLAYMVARAINWFRRRPAGEAAVVAPGSGALAR
ncbi:MAG: metal ABC transporter permease [Candidatus Dormibacteria bacterium]